MGKFRKSTPKRQNYTGPVLMHHGSHRTRLRKDFGGRCGYCDSGDKILGGDFHIDHFAPKEKFMSTHGHRLNEYTNLMYSCPMCNISKSDTWETQDFDNGVNGNAGFIKPCSISYEQQFERNPRGQIVPVTAIGKWMHQELNLGLKRHEILWLMSELKDQIDELQKSAPKNKKLITLKAQYYDLTQNLDQCRQNE